MIKKLKNVQNFLCLLPIAQNPGRIQGGKIGIRNQHLNKHFWGHQEPNFKTTPKVPA